MTINEVYNWLLETDPSSEDVKLQWTNMASYCYFINVMDFENNYQEKLKRVLQKSKKYEIRIPDDNHREVIEIAKTMKAGDSNELEKLLNNGTTKEASDRAVGR